MNYIVFDLEWNQSPKGKRYSDSKLPFEIIEIGAVKLNEKMEIQDTFQRLIRPKVYNWIHENIHEVIHVDYKDLQKGIPFPQAADEFLRWCGEEYFFFSWGNQDVMELQRNMKYYDMLERIPGPVNYYDVQKLFAKQYTENDDRRALEVAIEQLNIEKSLDFHRALADACYTAKVLQRIDEECMRANDSLDVYQNPKEKKDEVYQTYPEFTRYVSREFVSKEALLHDREVASTRCPVCNCAAKRKVRWFMSNPRVCMSVSFCQEHGYVEGKMRIRKAEDEKYFAVKKLRLVDMVQAAEVRARRDELKNKKKG